MDNVQVWDWLGQVNGDDVDDINLDLKRHNHEVQVQVQVQVQAQVQLVVDVLSWKAHQEADINNKVERERVDKDGNEDRMGAPVRITTTHRLHESLSEETRGLYRRLKDIERRQHILPRAAEALIRAEVKDVDLAGFIWQPLHTRTSDEVGTETKTETETRRAERTQAHAEFEAVLDIMFASNEAANEREGEPEWNEKVHYPVFELALGKPRHGALVQAQNITTARIAKPFQPPFRDSDDTMSVSSVTTAASSSVGTADTDRGSTWQATPAGGTTTASVYKMVDYAMDGTGTINQSTYGPLCRFPIGVIVETKTAAGTLDKAQFQLAVWTAAWHVRMDKLGHSGPQLRILSLPLITVVDAQWMLYFAVDQGDSICA
ncbi:hypothetical protein VMCG_10874 [Cytospora schulzeri]|uniref:PD-(D/E)XK nuclease-like domain-containing protein n=1 Tax=Cytospora schulzeri TaxID=448051 RepID=A0A423V7T3_9PEZI|nr:hypothetical protein VMCG_10874 [Valsa malicola]